MVLPERAPALPTTGLDVRARLLVGPGLTLGALVLIEVLDALGFEVPNASAIYFLPIVFSALVGGAYSGFLSASMALIYAFIVHSQPGLVFRYEAEDARRLIVLTIATPAVVWMVVAWKRVRDREAYAQVEPLRGQLAERSRQDAVTRHLAQVVDSSEEAIYSFDLAGRVLSWNAAAEGLYGFAASEIVGDTWHRIIPPDHQKDVATMLEALLRGDRVAHERADRRRKDGSLFRVSVQLSPVRDERGSVVAASAIAHEVKGV